MNEEQAIKGIKGNFYLFLRYMAPEDKTGWWLVAMCKFLQGTVYRKYINGERPLATLEAPVQHGKSRALRYFLCWLIGNHPELRYNFYTASDKLKDETVLFVDMVLQSEKYVKIFGKRKDSNKLTDNSEGFQIYDEFKKDNTGMVDFRLMGSGNIGHPSHVSIIDDPYKNKEDAYSQTMREKIKGRFRADIISRRQEKSMVVIMHSRWHVDDLIGYIKDKVTKELDDVVSFNYPAITEKGEALFPELRSLKFLHEQKKIMLEEEFMALYQQNPVKAGGNLFKTNTFRMEVPPEGDCDFSFITADTAYKDKEQNDYQVFSYWEVHQGILYLVDVIREQMKASEVENWCIPFIKKYSKYGFRGPYIEPKGHGIYLNQKLPTLSVLTPSQQDLDEFFKDRRLDKVQRANNVIPFLNNRPVYLNPNIACIEQLNEELLAFPRGKHDDFVDTLIDAIKYAYARTLSILDVI